MKDQMSSRNRNRNRNHKRSRKSTSSTCNTRSIPQQFIRIVHILTILQITILLQLQTANAQSLQGSCYLCAGQNTIPDPDAIALADGSSCRDLAINAIFTADNTVQCSNYFHFLGYTKCGCPRPSSSNTKIHEDCHLCTSGNDTTTPNNIFPNFTLSNTDSNCQDVENYLRDFDIAPNVCSNVQTQALQYCTCPLPPSDPPTVSPTNRPTGYPTESPTGSPSDKPSVSPTNQPSSSPTSKPSDYPSVSPTASPTIQPSKIPSIEPSIEPSNIHSITPTTTGTSSPSSIHSTIPSMIVSNIPSTTPSISPTKLPTKSPIVGSTSLPSVEHSSLPSVEPSIVNSSSPSIEASIVPTSEPTMTQLPSSHHSSIPSLQPSIVDNTNTGTNTDGTSGGSIDLNNGQNNQEGINGINGDNSNTNDRNNDIHLGFMTISKHIFYACIGGISFVIVFAIFIIRRRRSNSHSYRNNNHTYKRADFSDGTIGDGGSGDRDIGDGRRLIRMDTTKYGILPTQHMRSDNNDDNVETPIKKNRTNNVNDNDNHSNNSSNHFESNICFESDTGFEVQSGFDGTSVDDFFNQSNDDHNDDHNGFKVARKSYHDHGRGRGGIRGGGNNDIESALFDLREQSVDHCFECFDSSNDMLNLDNKKVNDSRHRNRNGNRNRNDDHNDDEDSLDNIMKNNEFEKLTLTKIMSTSLVDLDSDDDDDDDINNDDDDDPFDNLSGSDIFDSIGDDDSFWASTVSASHI